MSHSVNNGRAIIGELPRGEYVIKIWFGDLEMVGQLLYTGKVFLEERRQVVPVQLHNVTQRIQVFTAPQGTLIPVSLAGESVKIGSYRK